jgi:YVTN family beta-propeller protein
MRRDMKSSQVLALVSGCLTVGLMSACRSSRAEALADERVLVSNEDSGDISVLDARTGRMLGNVVVGMRPRGLRASADGTLIYVALSGSPKAGPGVDESKLPPPNRSADGIGVVDARRFELQRTLPSGPDPEAFDLAHGKLFVSNEDTARASIVNVTTGEREREVVVGEEPEGVTTRPDGRVVYVTSEAAGEVWVLAAASGDRLAHVAVGKRPRSIAFTSDSARAYVTNELDNSISVVNAQLHTVEQSIELPRSSRETGVSRPMGIAIAPDGAHAYVTTGRGGSVLELDLRNNAVTRSLSEVGARPWGIGVTRDGGTLYVANGPSNDVSVIDVASWRVARRIPVGRSPWGVAIAKAPTP